jgi:hypothetical protein
LNCPSQLGTFTAFAKKTKARYLKAAITRKRSKGGRVGRKILYAMKPDDRGNIIYWLEEATYWHDILAFLAQNINNYQYRYEEFIKSLKTNGFDVLGYTRKSPTNIPDERRKQILTNMISCLQSRSQVTGVYISPSSYSKSPIAGRDMTTDNDYTHKRLHW